MDSDAFANRITDENPKKDEQNNEQLDRNQVNVASYMGDHPLIGGIKIKQKEKFNIKDHLHFNLKSNKKIIPFIAIGSGLIIIIIALAGYLILNGYFSGKNDQNSQQNPAQNTGQNSVQRPTYLNLTFSDNKLPDSISSDPFTIDVSNINSTSSLQDTLARFLNLQIKDINYELKNIQIQYPE